MINGRHHGDADDDADEKVAFEGLLLGFMAKELLSHIGEEATYESLNANLVNLDSIKEEILKTLKKIH